MKPVAAGAVVAVVALGGALAFRGSGPAPASVLAGWPAGSVSGTATGTATGAAAKPARAAGAAVPVEAADKALSWKASELSQDEIKTRIAKADIAETDRLALMGAFKHAAGDPAALQSVLDKLRMAIAAAKKK